MSSKAQKIPRCHISGVFLLNKPLGISSNAALQKVRWLYRAQKAGHTGALDPLASGLLPICFGEAT
jgi:tRNA pseudouridine55 synthase